MNFETVGSIVAMVVGVSALFVAWDQAQVMRAQQHASVWPLINTEFTVDPSPEGLALEMSVSNRGVGPALIESASLLVNGEPVAGRAALLNSIFGDNQPAGSASLVGSSLESNALGAGESVQLFRMTWQANEENVAAFSALGQRYINGEGADIRLEICYCSVFNRCYVSFEEGRPKTVRSCPARTNLFTNLLSDGEAAAK
ncbi:MAG: hypothetical protein KDD85_02530 [Parvularculaceae bacterium]|nr:hypothetical protein [Parvularculaceae bacterium]